MEWYAADCAPGGKCPVCNAPPEPACVHCGDDGVEGDYGRWQTKILAL